jgi:phosphoadenosine phosphosulfate reductase
MSEEEITRWNVELRNKSPTEIIRWGLSQVGSGEAIVSTTFGPYTAVLLRLVTEVDPLISVLWVDHGYNRPATYRYAEKIQNLLNLKVHVYSPRLTAARRDVLFGPLPIGQDDESALQQFSALMKLEPFSRAMKDLKPRVWFTGIRQVQNSTRQSLDIVSFDSTFHVLKINPLFYWTDDQMTEFLLKNNLPNELDYFDPAKGDDKRECGLHSAWARNHIHQKTTHK